MLRRLYLSLCLSAFALWAASPALAARPHHPTRASRAHAKHAAARRHKRLHRRHAHKRVRMVRAITTSQVPKVTAAAASAITPTSATINGSVTPMGAATTYLFQYGASTSYGTKTAWLSVGSGTSAVSVKASMSNLTPRTTYHYRIVAQNTHGWTYGTDTQFTTSKLPPGASTGSADGLSAPAATLNGAVNPNGAATSYYFQYGTSSAYGSSTASQTAGVGTAAVATSASISRLQPATTYHFRLVASNPSGTSYGSDQAFVTPVASTYDQLVLSDHPVAYYDMNGSARESDLTGNGHTGSYVGGAPGAASLSDGEAVADFNAGTSHSGQYLTVPSSPVFSIPTTHQLTWEAWIRPDTLQFANAISSDQYVDWMGKCEVYSPSCEWEARMYSLQTPQGRASRLSAYAFNPTASLGSGSYWQPASGVIGPGRWLHVVAEYQTLNSLSWCPSGAPGTITIWVDGVPANVYAERPTGCMSQYAVQPVAGNSPLDIGTMAFNSWFQGAVGKVAIYGTLLSQNQISAHYQTMTGTPPSGSCAATCTIP